MKTKRIIGLLLALALAFALLPTAAHAVPGETEVAVTVKANDTNATVKPSAKMEVESVVWEGETVTVAVKIKDSLPFTIFAVKASDINATINGSPAGVERVDDKHVNVIYPKSEAPKLNEKDYIVSFPGDHSGSKDLPKLSQAGIAALIDAAPGKLREHPFEVEPSVTAPYSTGEVRESALQTAADRLTLMRRLAGLPGVELDAALSQQAQYGAVLLVPTGSLNHYPPQPAGMSNDFYQKGRAATSSSNLWSTGIAGWIPAVADYDLGFAPDAFMNDGGSGNEYAVGHRRWQLKPTLKKVGFGYATTKSDSGYTIEYITEIITDASGPAVDYDFISWPASGNFPTNLSAFGTSTEWSVTLNPSRYTTPSASSVVVTVTRASDGKVWTLSKDSGHFAVNTASYGVDNAIIFRPDGVSSYSGTYTVKIEGIKTKDGADASLEYRIDFFNASRPRDPSEEPNAAPAPSESATPSTPSTPPKPVVSLTTQKLTVDGAAKNTEIYNIDGANYFKLRDMAALLNGTGSQFSVDYDAGRSTIVVKKGAAYNAVGGELATGTDKSSTAVASTQSIEIDGSKADLSAYNIGGNNFFKLRDLGTALGFDVDYDSATATMLVKSR